MSSALKRFFAEQSSLHQPQSSLDQYTKRPVLQIEVAGIVGKVAEKSDEKGAFYEVSFLSTGENADYPKNAEIKSAIVRESKTLALWSLADNKLTLGGNKKILGFSAHEVDATDEINDVNMKPLSAVAYPDYKILSLSVAFHDGRTIGCLNGPKLCIPQTVQDTPEWKQAAASQHYTVDIGL